MWNIQGEGYHAKILTGVDISRSAHSFLDAQRYLLEAGIPRYLNIQDFRDWPMVISECADMFLKTQTHSSSQRYRCLRMVNGGGSPGEDMCVLKGNVQYFERKGKSLRRAVSMETNRTVYSIPYDQIQRPFEAMKGATVALPAYKFVVTVMLLLCTSNVGGKPPANTSKSLI
jgi:hypothetical protein